MSGRKQHSGEAGYVAERMNLYAKGAKVVIYGAAEQGIDAGGLRWAVVCDAHGTIVGERSIRAARLSMKNPANFCDGCSRLAGEHGQVNVAVLETKMERNGHSIEFQPTPEDGDSFGFWQCSRCG